MTEIHFADALAEDKKSKLSITFEFILYSLHYQNLHWHCTVGCKSVIVVIADN